MSLSTPRKRTVREVYSADSAGQDYRDSERGEVEGKQEIEEEAEESDDGIQGEAIDWQDSVGAIGPTPQKHGRIMGLFDSISPSKGNQADASSSSNRNADLLTAKAERPKGKEKKIKTPLKTPSFLRQQVIVVDEMGQGSTPRLLFPSAPKRGLSKLISELREIEDEQEDEGMDVLREMEAAFPNLPTEDVVVKKSVDGDGEMSSEKVKWKKKGLKRSHRRVVMRPTAKTAKAKPCETSKNAPEATGADDDSDEYINSEDEARDAQASLGLVPVIPASDLPAVEKKTQQSLAKRPAGVSHNFKSLKLRNTGHKGGSRFGRGKFGGRR